MCEPAACPQTKPISRTCDVTVIAFALWRSGVDSVECIECRVLSVVLGVCAGGLETWKIDGWDN